MYVFCKAKYIKNFKDKYCDKRRIINIDWQDIVKEFFLKYDDSDIEK